jgi:hypothetical protein
MSIGVVSTKAKVFDRSDQIRPWLNSGGVPASVVVAIVIVALLLLIRVTR